MAATRANEVINPQTSNPFDVLQASLSKHSYGDPKFYQVSSSSSMMPASPSQNHSSAQGMPQVATAPSKSIKSTGLNPNQVASEIDRLEQRQKVLSTPSVISMPMYNSQGAWVDHPIPGPVPKDKHRVYGYGSGHYGMPLPNPMATPEASEFIANQQRLQRLRIMQPPASSTVQTGPNGSTIQSFAFKDDKGGISDAFSLEIHG